jgi:hypothetical protein
MKRLAIILALMVAAGGALAAYSQLMVSVSAMPPLPPGVTLRAIDGGPTYYTNNGHTAAATMGWDNPSFFPIGPAESDYSTAVVPSAVTAMNALGWNTLFTWNSINTTAVTANNISTIATAEGAQYTGGIETNMVGIETQDEPSSYAVGVSTPIGQTVNATQDSMFWWVNCTHSFINGGGGTDGIQVGAPSPATPTSVLQQLVSTPSTKTRHIDLVGIDLYWFAGSRDPNWTPYMPTVGQQIYGLGSTMTTDQSERGSNYGDMVDALRAYQAAHYPAPLGIYIESGDPFWGAGSVDADVITPPEFNWASWSQIIHGARILYIFDHFGPPGGGGTTDDNLTDTRNTFFQTIQSGQSVSMYTQATATGTLIKNTAPVINAPFALSYASVSPAGYAFPTATLSLSGGFEVMSKYYTGGSFTNSSGTFPNGFYVFADGRYGEAATFPKTATFTLADTSATSATVVGESRSVSITSGVFTDSFATPQTVHIYQING